MALHFCLRYPLLCFAYLGNVGCIGMGIMVSSALARFGTVLGELRNVVYEFCWQILVGRLEANYSLNESNRPQHEVQEREVRLSARMKCLNTFGTW